MGKKYSRRTVLGAAALVSVAGCTALGTTDLDSTPIPDRETTTLESPRVDWPLGRGDSRNSGYGDFDGGTAPRELAWTVSGDAGVYAEPILAGGRLFYFDLDRRTIALEAKTGERLWSEQDGNWSTPAAADDQRVYVQGTGTGPGGTGSDFLVRDAQTGEIEWKLDQRSPTKFGPRLYDGFVYLGGSYDGTVTKYDAEDGDEQWRVELGDSVGPIAVDDDGIVACVDRETIARLDHDGDGVWNRRIGFDGGGVSKAGDVPTALSLHHELVLVSVDDGSLLALDTTSGDRRWRYETGSESLVSHPTIVNDRVFVVDRAGVVHAVTTDGDGVWTWETDTDSEGWRGDLFNYGINATNDWLYVLGFDDHVHVLDPDASSPALETRWDVGVAPSPPIVVGDAAVLTGTTTSVRAFTLE